jgi:hypothetical protein
VLRLVDKTSNNDCRWLVERWAVLIARAGLRAPGVKEARLARGGRRKARKRLRGKDASYVIKSAFSVGPFAPRVGRESAYVDRGRARTEERKVRRGI